MQLSWKLGRVAGIDLYLHATFLAMMGVLAMTHHGLQAVLMVTALFGCVLLHELGHALMARRFGIPTEHITLYPIGGVARLHRMPREPAAELLIALAGPAVNVAIALALFLIRIALGAVSPALTTGLPGLLIRELLVVNVLLAGFNLIPIFPMDGGRVLRALLSAPLGRLRATVIAATLGQVLAILAGVACLVAVVLLREPFLLMQVALAAFIYLAAGAELGQVRAEEDPLPTPVDAPAGYSWIYRGNGVWQLAPVILLDEPDHRPYRGARPWF
ncbi:site-2 protease family protein [Tautonia plasticadhaerens]|uniref:Zinc metalloprotease Rip3 n=1 Tax=Tautonia plasticadhaerens TaxID=2527974 RepID=A0A518H508_9BACT|nr:site-2 protease family protein [Tautonia plasticadhaerens]QDV35930.1 Putative zinc metalloprotease Rip3 [Tautonia plasticadhaerens]